MKKIMSFIFFITFITTFTIPCYASEITVKPRTEIEQSKASENSKEAIYKDMVISLLIPYMQQEINNYYKEYLSELPIIFPYSVDIVSVKRDSGYLIQLEVIVHPFVGPVNIVGDDRIIIETGAFGSVKVKKFEHIKSYPLPWNWQHIIKKPY
ncbi:Protein of unknown function [Clostridium amylolyticum]|uniref:DUF3888 domain-containing protein n=1 Tax=Clostridium amylolyticum TaxID=1121298 RepID=A0A1M6LZ40_9CLOT|nr:DUF3888 domain-containing protein [Clostridium amylolyticum]SHJ76509.1 Protein of unknown function [Clostridium amylolyticum]